eukprot:COSAG06_NODE_3865_length_4800_cov_4.083280_3_plen_1350_part_00
MWAQSAVGDDRFDGEAADPELALAGSSLFQSMTGFDDEISSASTVCEIRLGCRHASLTLMLMKEDAHDLPGGGVSWRTTAPASTDPWTHEPSAIFDCETTQGHLHLAADNLALTMPGDSSEADGSEWVAEALVEIQRVRCDEYLSLALGGCEYGKASVGASQMADGFGSGMAMGMGSHMSQSVFLPGPGSTRTFARNAISELARPSVNGRKQNAFSLRMLYPTRQANVGGTALPARKGSLALAPITLAIDTGLGKRLSALFPADEGSRTRPTAVEPPAVGSGAGHDDADAPGLEMTIECPKVTARLHFMMPDSETTPLSEYLELGPAASPSPSGAEGWRLTFRSWSASAISAGGHQLAASVCEQQLRLCQNRGEPALLCEVGGTTTDIAARLELELAVPASRGTLERTIPVPGFGHRGAEEEEGRGFDMHRARMAGQHNEAAAAVNVAISKVAIGKLKDADCWRLKDLLANLGRDDGEVAAQQPASSTRRVTYAPCPEPEPEMQEAAGTEEEGPVVELLERLTARMPGFASVLSIEAQELTVAVRGQYRASGADCSEEEEDFDPYGDDGGGETPAIDYGYYLRAQEFRVLNVTCPSGDTGLSCLNVSAARLFLNEDDDAAARGNPCLLETAKMDGGHAHEEEGSAPGIGRVALLYERLTNNDGASSTVVQSSGLRFRPRWGVRPPDGNAIPLDLVDTFRNHIYSFFALGDSDEDEDERRLLVRVEDIALVLSAPPVKASSSSGMLLRIGSLRMDLFEPKQNLFDSVVSGNVFSSSSGSGVEICDTALFLTDDHRKGKGGGPISEANLARYVETYRKVLKVPVLSVAIQNDLGLVDVDCGDASGAAPSVSLHTCGDSFRTLSNLVQEIVEARTTELDSRKTPSGKPHAVSHAVFADSQSALIGRAEETTAYEESTEVVQMEAVTWGSMPVIHDSYIDESLQRDDGDDGGGGGGGGGGSDDAVRELTRSTGSTDSHGFEFLAEEEAPRSVPLGTRPAAAPAAAAASHTDLGRPDVPDSDHEAVMFEPVVLVNLMESYMQDDSSSSGGGAGSDTELGRIDDFRNRLQTLSRLQPPGPRPPAASAAAAGLSAEPPPRRLRTPPGIEGGSLAEPAAPVPAAAPPPAARMAATYPEPAARIAACVPKVVWYIHEGQDWPAQAEPASQTQPGGGSRRDHIILELHSAGLKVEQHTFLASKEGDVEWHLQVTLRDLYAFDRVPRSNFQEEKALAVQQVVPNRQRETHSSAVVLAVDSVRAVRQDIGIDIKSLLKLKLVIEPIRLWVDGGMLRRLTKFFHDEHLPKPRPPVMPRPDDARFQLAEVGGLSILLDYVRLQTAPASVLAAFCICLSGASMT